MEGHLKLHIQFLKIKVSLILTIVTILGANIKTLKIYRDKIYVHSSVYTTNKPINSGLYTFIPLSTFVTKFYPDHGH